MMHNSYPEGVLFPTKSLTREEVRELDRRAIQEFGIPGMVLMENAGRNTVELLWRLGIAGQVVICAGKGNNGGDGFVMARHLENRNVSVELLLFCEPEELQGDAAANYRICEHTGTPMTANSGSLSDTELTERFSAAEWIVDALLGTGTRGEVREPFQRMIPLINNAAKKVLAVDLPSGLDCNTGESLGVTVRATHTATFIAAKTGFENPDSTQWTGAVHLIDIGMPRSLWMEL